MRIDQLALLFALVIAANLVLLAALELPWRGRLRRAQPGDLPRETSMGGGEAETHTSVDRAPHAMESARDEGATGVLYSRVVRVVSFMFIGSVLVIESLVGGPRGGVYVLAAVGAFLIVLFQDVLAKGSLGRWRRPVEAGAAIGFLAALVALTGGQDSPYFFGYILLLGAASLWASGIGPPLLAIITSASYLAAVVLAPGAQPLTVEAMGRVAFNLVTLALVTYVASVIGREQRHAREEALLLSRFDAMTGLYSRIYFQSAIEQEILRAARTGRAFGLLMIDLDGLKAANDRFGHASGDRLLIAIADVLRGAVRVTDVAARYGGDEFVLMLPETDLAGSMRVAEKVRVDIARLTLPHNGSFIRSSASIGAVTYPDDGRTSTELLRRADLAMYEAKRRGRDQIVRYARETSVPIGAPANVSPPAQMSTPAGPPLPAAARTSAAPTTEKPGTQPDRSSPRPTPLPQPPQRAAARAEARQPAPWDSAAGPRR